MDTFERDGVLALRARRAGGETVQLSANGENDKPASRDWPEWLKDAAHSIDYLTGAKHDQ